MNSQMRTWVGHCGPTIRAFALGVVFAGNINALGAQGMAIRGLVADSSANPIPFAQVSVRDGSAFAITDSAGRFILRVGRRDRADLRVRRIGFVALEVSGAFASDSARDELHIVLTALPHVLSGTATVAAANTLALVRSGFYDRMVDRSKGLNNGTFILPEDIEARHPSSVLNLIQGAAPSVSLLGKKVMGQGGACMMDVYVNRQRVDAAPLNRGTHSLGSDRIAFQEMGSRRAAERAPIEPSPVEETAPAGSVVGVEIYPRAVMAPPEFQRLAGSCGIVLIWTK
jgi:hypothetical protein